MTPFYRKPAWEANFRGTFGPPELQIPIDEIVLLPPQPLADLAGADGADAVDGLEVAMAGPDHGVEALEVAHDVADHRVGQAGNPREDAIAARLHCVVERVRLP